jgi:transcriptional regulator with XRE-family HTH domain
MQILGYGPASLQCMFFLSMLNRMAKARERAGLSLSQASKLIDAEKKELIEWEDPSFPARSLSPDRLSSLAEVYGVTVPWICGVDPEIPKDNPTMRMIRNSGLTSEEKAELREFIQSTYVGT